MQDEGLAELTITKDDFLTYEEVRMSGVTNMYDVRFVQQLSGLARVQIFYIMDHYAELASKYLE